jgi:hypothetical protein
MVTKEEILSDFAVFSIGTGGIGSWLTSETRDDIFRRLSDISENPLTAVQLNQLLVLGHEAPVSDAFFQYYWLHAPEKHPYDVKALPDYSDRWISSHEITSLGHLKWGLYRLYIDALLYFGNVRTAFRSLRDLRSDEIECLFSQHRFDTEAIERRGPPLPLAPIAKDSRYLISEMACKSYGNLGEPGDLLLALGQLYEDRNKLGGRSPTIRQLLDDPPAAFKARQGEFLFSADEVLDDLINSPEELASKVDAIAKKFADARKAALNNTCYYLSMVNDLDVYVATSMRSRRDFRNMADTCEKIFSDTRLRDLNLRYFDPTLSAAEGHEDKGLIECLMVKCAKALVYCAGERESYGKDAEAAMALSLGKPVIFYCDEEQRGRFYREVHPLSRLIEFETGVAVGAMVTDRPDDVSELLYRMFSNRMIYTFEHPKPGFLRLKEALTKSVVRLQTNDRLLSETFWNHYHKDREKRAKAGIGKA